MIMLTPRLEKVAELVWPGQAVADIGTDHAYIPIYLVQSGRTPAVIATDIHDGPYKIARDKVRAYGLQNKINVRKGNGLRPIQQGEVKVAIIAGMGGITIKDILQQAPQIVTGLEQLVLQPMTAPEEVRKWLAVNGWKLEKELLIKEEEKYYQIISAVRGSQTWPALADSLLWQLGPTLIHEGSPVMLEYLDKLLAVNMNLLAELDQVDSPKAMARRTQLKVQKEELEELRKKCRLNANR